MVLPQYEAYNQQFSLPVPIRPSARKGLRGIGGSGKVPEDANIQINFTFLELIIDVYFTILAEDAPSLLFNRDMITNRLYISLQ